jgi:hypothetical protein
MTVLTRAHVSTKCVITVVERSEREREKIKVSSHSQRLQMSKSDAMFHIPCAINASAPHPLDGKVGVIFPSSTNVVLNLFEENLFL